MSNIIPIVSSSPPPFDDDGGWDDDDDDFGNFASAPDTASKEDEANSFTQGDSFEVNWSSPADTFQNAEESSKSQSALSGTTVFFNGVTDESHRQVDSSNLESQTTHQKHKQCEKSLSSSTPENGLSDIPNSVDSTASNLDSHTGLESEITNTEARVASGAPNSEENATLAGSKINESVFSTSSTTDSGIFSSDLSPSSYPESSSIPQDNCDSNISPNSHPSYTAENSDNNIFNGVYSSEGHQKHSQETQDTEDSIQCEGQHIQGSSTVNCDKEDDEDDDGDWGDFNDAVVNSYDSSSEKNVSFPAFDDNALFASTADKADDIGSGEIPQIVSEAGITVHNGCDAHSTESENNVLSHNISNKNFISSSEIVTSTSRRDHHTKNYTEGESEKGNEGSLQAELSDDVSKGTLEEEQPATEDFHSVAFEENSLSGSGDRPLSPDENFAAFETVNMESCETEVQNDRSNEEQTVLEAEDKDEISEHEVTVKSSIEDSVKTEDGYLKSSDTEKDEEASESTPENAVAINAKDDKEINNLDDTEFGSFENKKNDLSDEVTPISFRLSVCEDDIDENEGNGKEKPPPFDDGDDDDFGDFGDFNSTQTAGLSEMSDDFGDFDSGMKDMPEAPSNTVEEDDDFGDFGDASGSGNQDAGWADFGNSAPTFEAQPESCNKDLGFDTPVTAVTRIDQNKNKIVLAVEKCFPVGLDTSVSTAENSQNGTKEAAVDTDAAAVNLEDEVTALDVVVELGLANIQEAKQQTWTVVQHPAKKDPRVRVWGQMKDVDASHALGYAWPTSHCSQEVFGTLHIDTQNILFTQKKQAVPFFASGLGILEPTRGGNTATETKKEKVPGLGTPLQPALLDTTASSKNSTATAAQDIPPVDFDWSVSGLTNPLTVFKSDAESGTSSQPGLQPLEEMLKKSTPTAKLATQEVVSPEAQRILAKMPDLSFMQSKVLMFPVKQ